MTNPSDIEYDHIFFLKTKAYSSQTEIMHPKYYFYNCEFPMIPLIEKITI